MKNVEALVAKMQELFPGCTHRGTKFNTRSSIGLGELDQINQMCFDHAADIIIKRSGAGLVIIFS